MEPLGDVAAPKTEHTIRFDDPDPNLHDVIIIVDGKKFYCSKMTLAKHSPRFYKMFFEDEQLKGERELTLTGANSDEFDSFLQIIHGVPKLNDDLVEGVLEMATQWTCAVARQNCIHFLNTSSALSYRKKFKLAQEFDLMDVKKRLIAECKTCDKLHNLVPYNVQDLDRETMALFFERNLALQGFPGRYVPGMQSPSSSSSSSSLSSSWDSDSSLPSSESSFSPASSTDD
ncbi:unnamed protein product [Caenorhabditis brenneri]